MQQEKIKVLVIDDSSTIRKSAQIFLKKENIEVLVAEDGYDGLTKIVEYNPTIIFCDVLMPKLDGYQTCMLVKRNPKFAKIPFVMLSAKDSMLDKAKGMVFGSEAYLTKPFTKQQLVDAISSFSNQQ